MKEIKLSNVDKVIQVDDEDFDRLSQFSWCYFDKSGGRITRSRNIPIANEVMRDHLSMFDHIDRNSLNNQKFNLRKCSMSQNCMNRTKRKNTKSKYKGVTFYSDRNKWVSRITLKQKVFMLGAFNTEQEAALAYNRKAVELFKEFALLNVVP